MLKPEDIIEFRKRGEEFRQQYWENNPEYKKQQEEKKKWREDQWAQGKIIDPYINKWLEGEIAAARNVLIIGMILTALIKGQIFIWAIMYVAYRGRVKKATQEAIESDRKRYDRK